MKPCRSNQNRQAMTLVEVLVVIVVLAILAAMFLPALAQPRHRHSHMNCVNNLKQIGLAYKTWAGDNNDKFPMEVSITNGGAMELASSGKFSAVFEVMSNELSTTKLLICPQDNAHTTARNFTTDFNNSKISYFVGLDANQIDPQAFLSGDDNFQARGATIKSGLFTLWTNTPVAWSSTRHKFAGNIGFADGSVQSFNNQGLRELLQHETATNRLAIP